MNGSLVINICGNIASGKSTLAAALQDWFNFPVIIEDTSRISLFEKYCTDPKSWASLTQVQFMIDKFARALVCLTDEITIMDRSLDEDALIFAKLHRDIGNISDSDFSSYLDIYHGALNFLPKRRINILVTCSRLEQERRINNRGEKERLMLTSTYLDALGAMYSEYVLSSHFDLVFSSETDSTQSAVHAVEKCISDIFGSKQG